VEVRVPRDELGRDVTESATPVRRSCSRFDLGQRLTSTRRASGMLYQRRNDAESHNRRLDDTLWLRRARSMGNRRQLLNMITYALGVNALSMNVRRQGLAPPQAA
jgi:hypothetical protein